MLSFMHAHSTFFHQGHDLFNEFDPEMKQITSQVSGEYIGSYMRWNERSGISFTSEKFCLLPSGAQWNGGKRHRISFTS